VRCKSKARGSYSDVIQNASGGPPSQDQKKKKTSKQNSALCKVETNLEEGKAGDGRWSRQGVGPNSNCTLMKRCLCAAIEIPSMDEATSLGSVKYIFCKQSALLLWCVCSGPQKGTCVIRTEL